MTVKKTKKGKPVQSQPVLLKFLFLLDDLFCGKKGGRTGRQMFYKQLLEALHQRDAALLLYVQDLLAKDLEKIKIKRDFLDLSGTAEEAFKLLHQDTGLSGIFNFQLFLSSLWKDDDLVADITALGRNLDSQVTLKTYFHCLELLKHRKNIIPEHIAALQGLRNIANDMSLVGSGKALPEITISLKESDQEYKDVVAAISRYPVKEELDTLQTTLTTSRSELLDDIADIFRDYSRGELRMNALNKLPNMVTMYLETPLSS